MFLKLLTLKLNNKIMKTIFTTLSFIFCIQVSIGQLYNNIPYRLCTDCPQTENASLLNTAYSYGGVVHYGPLNVTSDYGARWSDYRWHNGIDLRPYLGGSKDLHRGTGILSIENGIVEHIKIIN
jgi:hypothetical protein